MNIRPLWHDEACVALSVTDTPFFSVLNNIQYSQKAPILFWFMIKISGFFGNYNEVSLRFFPFIFSLVSVPVFYILSSRFLTNKYCIILANLFFAINLRIIYYSQEVKQYAGDVLFYTAAIIIYEQLAKKAFKKKEAIFTLLLTTFLIFSSFPCWFAAGGFFLYKLIHSEKKEKLYILITGFTLLLISSVYILKNLILMHNNELAVYESYWNSGFIGFHNIIPIFTDFFKYIFYPFIYAKILIIPFLTGILLNIKEEKTVAEKIFIYSLFFVTAASALQIYPIYKRTALYLIPYVIIYIFKVFEKTTSGKKIEKVISGTIILIILLINIPTFNRSNYMKPLTLWNGRETLKYIAENYNPRDIILLNVNSESQFNYYSRYYNFRPDNVIIYNAQNKSKEEFIDYLNKLEAKKTYWFYDVLGNKTTNREQEYITEWQDNPKIITLSQYIILNSYVSKIIKKY